MRSIICTLICSALFILCSGDTHSEGLAPVGLALVEIDDKYGFIDTKGQYVVNS